MKARPTGIHETLIAHPLDEFYSRHELALPPLQQVDPEEIPEPYRSLLVHESDMTSTLESFHGGTIHLEVLLREQRSQAYYREVVLRVAGNEQAVEFGAIKIDLSRFPAEARQEILEARWPLGRILKNHGIEYSSRPKAFLKIASDKLINRVLGLQGAHVLYGRRNTLLDPEGKSLAEIVEILPPASVKQKEQSDAA